MAMHRLHLRKIRRQRIRAQPWKADSATRRWARRARRDPRVFESSMRNFFRSKFTSPSFFEQILPAVRIPDTEYTNLKDETVQMSRDLFPGLRP